MAFVDKERIKKAVDELKAKYPTRPRGSFCPFTRKACRQDCMFWVRRHENIGVCAFDRTEVKEFPVELFERVEKLLIKLTETL